MGRFYLAGTLGLPATGKISVGDINGELGTSGARSIGQTDGRTLVGKTTGSISLGDYRGKSSSSFVINVGHIDFGDTVYWGLFKDRGGGGCGSLVTPMSDRNIYDSNYSIEYSMDSDLFVIGWDSTIGRTDYTLTMDGTSYGVLKWKAATGSATGHTYAYATTNTDSIASYIRGKVGANITFTITPV